MSKLKKVLLMCTAYALVAVLAIGGTLAYLTDRDSEVNVFTVGNVSIDLTEDFEQGAELIPGVKIEKEARITNTGDNAAWVWMTMAIPAALDSNDTSTVGNMNILHWNVPGAVWAGYGDNANWMTADKIAAALENGYITEEHLNEDKNAVKSEHMWTICQTADAPVAIKQETIDNVAYNVYTFLYNAQLAADATTPVALHQVYLDASVDIDTDGQWYSVKNGEATKIEWNSNTNGNPMVYVNAYAMQANEFDSVLDAYKAYNKQWGDNGAEKTTPAEVAVTPENLASVDFAQDNTIFTLSGTFAGNVTFSVPEGLNQTFDGTNAVFSGAVVFDRGIAHASTSLDAARTGNLTITNFNATALCVNAINMESVNITNNTVNALSVAGGNLELIIKGNSIDGNAGQYVTGNTEHNTIDYGITLRITDYELSILDNVITDTYSHAIGINGRQDEANTVGWINRGANNVIEAFSGNKITVNSTKKSARAALKIWNDSAYAPYATSGKEPNAKAKALMDSITVDSTNVFTLGEGHTTFNIYDYKQ